MPQNKKTKKCRSVSRSPDLKNRAKLTPKLRFSKFLPALYRLGFDAPARLRAYLRK
jgi:hypothetical protein